MLEANSSYYVKKNDKDEKKANKKENNMKYTLMYKKKSINIVNQNVIV